MRTIIYIILCAIMAVPLKATNLVKSKWICELSSSCCDTINLYSDNQFEDYSCELNYTCKGHYSFKNGIVILIEKDDSHDEDNGKVSFYRLTFKLYDNCLYPISDEVLVNGIWKKMPKSLFKKRVFHRVN